MAAAAQRGRRERSGPVSVSELTRELKGVVERSFADIRVQGEVLSARASSSGHLYFTLKDERAQLPCVIWRSTLARLPLRVRDGLRVVASGDVQIYPPHGRYQLVVRRLSDAGVGDLLARREALRRQLAAEGLFDDQRKRPLPLLPRRVGVVTAATGAAIRDILTTIYARFPAQVVLYPARVQGAGAAREIARGVQVLGGLEGVDVIIVGRGGGSLEDLWAFEEEPVVRAIAACPVPVISAVGHEIDHPLSDDAADRRAATPTAAGELVVPSITQLRQGLERQRERLALGLRAALERQRQRVADLTRRLGDPRRQVADRQQALDMLSRRLDDAHQEAMTRRRQRLARAGAQLRNLHPRDKARAARQSLDQLEGRLTRAARHLLDERRKTLAATRRTLTVLSPTASLDRGYAIVRRPSGPVLRHAHQVEEGETLEIVLRRGGLSATVTARRERNAYEMEER